jgi:hypothetical protein
VPEDAPSGDGPSLDEDALRRLLQESVQDLEPGPDTLEHLRRAVPARRARHRQALVGVAAAVLVGGAAIPALLHTDLMSDGQERPMHVAGHEHSQGLKGDGGAHDVQGPGSGKNSGGAHTGAGKGRHHAGASSSPSAGESSGPDPSASLGAVSPSCDRTQLGDGTAVTGNPDAQGRVYGTFRVVNISGASCTIEGDGLVVATAQGSADPHHVQVVDHTAGDAAPGLPDPATAPDELVLKPGAAYVVKFAWVPQEGGGPTGCSSDPSTPPATGADRGSGTSGGTVAQSAYTASTAPGAAGGDGTASSDGGTGSGGTGGGTDDGSGGSDDGSGGTGGSDPQPQPSVALSHTPDMGGPAAAGTVLEGACAGTVYRTGVLPASS